LAWNSAEATSVGASAAIAQNSMSAPDLFAELDGSDFVAAGQTWHVEIYGVFDNDGYRWIQLGLNGPRTDLATLRLVQGAGPQQAVMALTAWLAERAIDRSVLNVA
jgi:hypothetical protein